MKTAVMILLLCLVGLAALTWAGSHPYSIKCPVDGNPMAYDHQVGYGRDAVCWYSHRNCDGYPIHCEKHEAYIPCGD